MKLSATTDTPPEIEAHFVVPHGFYPVSRGGEKEVRGNYHVGKRGIAFAFPERLRKIQQKGFPVGPRRGEDYMLIPPDSYPVHVCCPQCSEISVVTGDLREAAKLQAPIPPRLHEEDA